MEGLSKMLDKTKHLLWLDCFSVGRPQGNPISISHLLYADDTLVFCGAEKSQVQYLNLTLLIFEAISGLHINILKSIIYQVNEVPDLEALADILCCGIGSFPATYLGLPLGAKFKSVEVWNVVLEKVEKRLATWQMQYLSMGGRLTFISSVIDSIPTYFMSLYPMPSKVLKQLDKLGKNFLWKGNNEGHKFHLVKWVKVTQPKDLGGHGIKDLAKHNKSMLMKWVGRFGEEDTSLWKKVVIAKHGQPSHWCTKLSRPPMMLGHGNTLAAIRRNFLRIFLSRLGMGCM
uniref:Uncharacterized protein LOC104241713 n=1 Tax=Nicotiana sylvestris TaxID=4096 RepID=A0A1U7Y6S6_NICSY|nr:PREDICTED: uncharacterized protein LOC104241713 [Nicotiana sylvestris]